VRWRQRERRGKGGGDSKGHFQRRLGRATETVSYSDAVATRQTISKCPKWWKVAFSRIPKHLFIQTEDGNTPFKQTGNLS